MLVELFKVAEGAAVLTTITIAAATVPHAIISGEDLTTIVPVITLYEHDDRRIYPEAVSYTHLTLPTTPYV